MLGRSLGNYGVVSKIGEGGMGVVYLAKHVTLGRRAAIKVLRPDLSSNQDIISRFFNEARAATAVRNPGIVEVYDFGFLEDRTAYIIMEYLDGESLASRIRRGRAPIGATLTIVRAIARILQSAHEQGIVHRDLKPDNVFLVPDAELASGERVKLLDFGIAKLAHGLGNASHTTTGTVMGTPTYMAPEQCRGAGAVDHRADLYSLGCLAYEMLCGQPPFVADGPGDVIARHLYFEPAPLRSHRSEIPPELEVIILRLLKKEPRDRYSNAAEFVRATDPLMKGTPSAAAPPGDVLKTEFVATLAVVSDTTLNGAASSRSTPKARPSSRFTLIAGAVGVTIAILVFVLVIFTRGARNGDATSSPMVAATGEPRATEGLVPSAPLASAPSTPQATLPGGVATPSAGAPSAAASPKNLTPDTHSGETGLSPNPTASVVPAPDVAPPTPAPRVEPSAPAGATSSGEAGRPAVGTADADNVGKPGDATRRTDTGARRDRRSPAVKSASTARPRASGKSVDATHPSDASEFPKWTDTLKPGSTKPPGEVTSPDTKAPAAAAPNGAARPVESARPEAAKPPDDTKPAAGQPGVVADLPKSTAEPRGTNDASCALAAFNAVLDAKTPSRAALDDAWSRLGKCKSIMKPALYSDIQRRLVEKS